MRDGSPSRTAQLVAAQRLTATRVAAPYGDPAADDRLARDVAGDVPVDEASPMRRYLLARTAFFDRFTVAGIDADVTQFVSIGAGYDGRSLRYAAPGVRWFEIDHPDTQRDKRARLHRLGIRTEEVSLLPATIGVDPLAPALLAAGFEPVAPARLLCEGLAVYLTPAVLCGLLEELRGVAGAGSLLALSSGCITSDPIRRAAFRERVAALGEPVALGDADVSSLLSAAGWRLIELPERSADIGLVLARPG
jgi:methyltransferase (TIGR00027 family)